MRKAGVHRGNQEADQLHEAPTSIRKAVRSTCIRGSKSPQILGGPGGCPGSFVPGNAGRGGARAFGNTKKKFEMACDSNFLVQRPPHGADQRYKLHLGHAKHPSPINH